MPKRIVAFVLPTGYAFSMDGTALYTAMASISGTAAGIHMPVEQQILMMMTLMLTSKGLAAVPVPPAVPPGDPRAVRPSASGGRRHPRRGRADGYGPDLP